MTKEEKLDDFIRYVSMTDEERAAVIDTGLFNSYISAYMKLTLRELFGSSDDERITDAAARILGEILEDTQALRAKELAEKP